MNVLPKIVSTRQLCNVGTATPDMLERMRPFASQVLELHGAVLAYRTGENKDGNDVLRIVKGHDLAAAAAELDVRGGGLGILVAETLTDAENWLMLTGEETAAPQPAPTAQPKPQPEPKSKLAELARLPRHEQDALIAAARKRKNRR